MVDILWGGVVYNSVVSLYEILGIWASFFVLVSFLMKKIWLIRTVNIIGCVLFIVYGILTGAWSIWFFNAALLVIHVVFLWVYYAKKKNLSTHK